MKEFYAPTFIDESRSRKGNPTGNMNGLIFTRRFYKGPTGEIKASRGVKPFHWSEDTEEDKAKALRQAIYGMKEMPELDANPPLTFIPKGLRL